MDRGAWWATVHGATQSDMTDVTKYAHAMVDYKLIEGKDCFLLITDSLEIESNVKYYIIGIKYKVNVNNTWLK